MMTEEVITNATTAVTNLNEQSSTLHRLHNNAIDECEEAVTTDSDEYLSEPLKSRYKGFQFSISSTDSNTTLTPQNLTLMEGNGNFMSCVDGMNLNHIQVPIVGYEVMEERARFTVFKLRVENKSSGDCWYVFRRYTDFVRLCNKLKHSFPNIVQLLPRKKWIGNNFDSVFLDERVNGLQTLVNAILGEIELASSQLIQDFLCLNEPPVYSDTNQESRAMFEALEETIYQLKQQLKEKETDIDQLQDSLHTATLENENLKKVICNSTLNCQKCHKDFENISKTLKITRDNLYNNNKVVSPASSSQRDS